MNFAFPPQLFPTLPIHGNEDVFPVRRIYCVGRNYADHVKEMGHDVKEPPFFFQKNPDTLVQNGGNFPYPAKSENVHYEIELVVALHVGGKNIPESEALEHVYGYAVGLDMTRRDLQNEMKKMGRSWEVAKAFEHAAPCGEIVRFGDCGHINKGNIWLNVNGEPKQKGNLSEMIWSVPQIIVHLSGLFHLAPGDLIFTGTPAGVGPIQPGDAMQGGIEGVGELTINVV